MTPRIIVALLLSSALSACVVGPKYTPPVAGLTQAYVTDQPLAAADPQWWHSFGDPVLDTIVERALAQNYDLAAAAARIQQARALAGGAAARLLPTVDAAGSAEADHQSLHTPFGIASNELGFPRNYELYQAGVQASWELDLFGGLTRRQQAARAQLSGTIADAAAVRLGVEAETVDAYLQLRGAQAQLQVAQAQYTVADNLVTLISQREAQGLSAPRDVLRATGDRDGVAARIPRLNRAIAAQINAIDVLTGQQAGGADPALAQVAAIPAPPQPSGSAIPADLMRRRPDVVAAESQMVAANAQIGAALSKYYPHLSFSGLLGVASVGGTSFLGGGAVQTTGQAALRWRLFDFGRIDAEVKQARGHKAETMAQYRATLLHATADVENAMVALTQGRNEVTIRQQQVAALTRSRDQAQQAYGVGTVALIEVLDADRALLEASDELAQARAMAARASLATTRALGGGYTQGTTHG